MDYDHLVMLQFMLVMGLGFLLAGAYLIELIPIWTTRRLGKYLGEALCAILIQAFIVLPLTHHHYL